MASDPNGTGGQSDSLPPTGDGSPIGGVDVTYTFDKPVKIARVINHDNSPGYIWGRWDIDVSALDDFDFILAPGESEWSPPFIRLKRLSIFTSVAFTENEDFSIRGFVVLS